MLRRSNLVQSGSGLYIFEGQTANPFSSIYMDGTSVRCSDSGTYFITLRLYGLTHVMSELERALQQACAMHGCRSQSVALFVTLKDLKRKKKPRQRNCKCKEQVNTNKCFVQP